jgi:4-carboxymuconolactone decarboxylase
VTRPSTVDLFNSRLELLASGPLGYSRGLAIYAATIALADESAMTTAIVHLRARGVNRADLYEIVLQSYLFLGFPRMLIAAETLAEVWPPSQRDPGLSPPTEVDHWRQRGEALYQRVYGANADRLRKRVVSFAPEIFEWMIIEGYGKVLSRAGLDIVPRELAIVAFLIVDNRPKQLMSHIRGAMLVGATIDQLRECATDLESVAPEGAYAAAQVLKRFGVA